MHAIKKLPHDRSIAPEQPGAAGMAEQCSDLCPAFLPENRVVANVNRWIGKIERGVDRGIRYHALGAMNGHNTRGSPNVSGKRVRRRP